MGQTPDFNDAVAHLRAYRSAWNTGDGIDEYNGVTTDDLDTSVSFVADFSSNG
jgi:hypothetical protein